MSSHTSFSYKNAEELKADARSRGLNLPWVDDLSVLAETVRVGGKSVPNRFAVLPVEGRDANFDGTPSELTFRRYRRYAAGGSGLIHFEAVAFSPRGRASDTQLLLMPSTAGNIKALLDAVREEAWKKNGHTPLCYIQLQESGRYAKASGMTPRLVVRLPEFDRRAGIADDAPIVSDEELDDVRRQFVDAAVLAHEIGFDGVDVKACHRYLTSELLAAHTRGGRYGGSYENRVRMVLESMKEIRERIPDPDFHIVSRFNLYDAIAWPFGWGVAQKDSLEPDMTEPLRLLGQMREQGVAYVSTTCGTPYGRAWVNRPFDRHIPGSPMAPEHPLEGVCRGIALTGQAQRAYPEVPMAGFGYSWLREHIPYVAAGIVSEGRATFVGLGRELLAYPDMPNDILRGMPVDKTKLCVTCSLCSEIMAHGGVAGCYVRDRQEYDKFLKQYRAQGREK